MRSSSIILSTVFSFLIGTASSCCYMVAEMETCSSLSGYSQVGGEGSIFKGVKSINCCEVNATQVFSSDASWCTGSEGASMEMEMEDTNNNAAGGADVIISESHTESVEESHTEEHSESHSEEIHTESSSTTTTTTDGSNAGVGVISTYSYVVVMVSAVFGGLSL